MASETENAHMGPLELEELEVFEVDEALLRELLEEQEDHGDAENGKKMMEKEQEHQKQKQRMNSSEQHEDCNEINYNVHEFEWVNNMVMMDMEPDSVNDLTMNWYPDDMIEMMVDFGYDNSNIGECYVSNEASYGCLWENL